ncbi:MAG: hypothetical protein Q8Q14_14815, partial [Gemmatimonadales bacterium]|nr:hypothetical protein [Gemmatimonadales bacterium]
MTLGYGKLPWVTEADIWTGLPKTARIPTGGWRGIGAVPSHSYPAPSTLPDGYWAGLGMVASVADPMAQGVKTWAGGGFGGFGAEPTAADYLLLAAKARDAGKLAEAAIYEQKAKEAEAAAKSAASTSTWTSALQAIVQAGAQAYSASTQYNIQRDLIKAGVSPTAFLPGAPAPAPTQTAALTA